MAKIIGQGAACDRGALRHVNARVEGRVL